MKEMIKIWTLWPGPNHKISKCENRKIIFLKNRQPMVFSFCIGVLLFAEDCGDVTLSKGLHKSMCYRALLIVVVVVIHIFLVSETNPWVSCNTCHSFSSQIWSFVCVFSVAVWIFHQVQQGQTRNLRQASIAIHALNLTQFL